MVRNKDHPTAMKKTLQRLKDMTTFLIPLNVILGVSKEPNHWILFYVDITAKEALLIDSSESSLASYMPYVETLVGILSKITGEVINAGSVTYLEDRPIQTNDYDCGLIVCMHLYWYSRFRSVEAFKKKDYWN